MLNCSVFPSFPVISTTLDNASAVFCSKPTLVELNILDGIVIERTEESEDMVDVVDRIVGQTKPGSGR